MALFKYTFYKNAVFLLFSILLICTYSNAQNVIPAPNPARLVVDKAGLLSAQEQAILEQKLVNIDDSSSNQIAVVIIPTLEDGSVVYSIEEYATKLFRTWGIGGKKNNNGVLLLIAAKEHKIRIETGFGLEGAITDIQSKSIIDNDLTPFFKKGDYYTGIDKATTDLAKAAIGEYRVPRNKQADDSGGGIIFLIILFIIIAILFGTRRGGGNGGGGVASRDGWSNMILPIIFSGLGGGRGGSGGFGGGGGFGGFGGGSSGGGGASGGW